ncbi:hypothetical protein FVE85_8259 [Porphyridium purpureum]|uniref:Uncharacterized protein n=1 Tax=Porphyridium purpureum TaxID=35688 RepID=A0A5J4YMY6_PORPP|nr:hypothetical protein FVE85_8259 [Porphyridium purpureum]|eukprot:POR2032..scf244_11
MKIAVIGGGLQGCAAVYYVNQVLAADVAQAASTNSVGGQLQGHERESSAWPSHPHTVVLFEESHALGGHAISDQHVGRMVRFTRGGILCSLVTAAGNVETLQVDTSFGVFDWDRAQIVFSTVPLLLIPIMRWWSKIMSSWRTVHWARYAARAFHVLLVAVVWLFTAYVAYRAWLHSPGIFERLLALLKCFCLAYVAVITPHGILRRIFSSLSFGYGLMRCVWRYGVAVAVAHGAQVGSVDAVRQLERFKVGMFCTNMAQVWKGADLDRVVHRSAATLIRDTRASEQYQNDIILPAHVEMGLSPASLPELDVISSLLTFLAMARMDPLATAPLQCAFGVGSARRLCSFLTQGAEVKLGHTVTAMHFSGSTGKQHRLTVRQPDGSFMQNVDFDAVLVCTELAPDMDASVRVVSATGERIAVGELLGSRRTERLGALFVVAVEGRLCLAPGIDGARLPELVNVVGRDCILKRILRIPSARCDSFRLEFFSSDRDLVYRTVEALFPDPAQRRIVSIAHIPGLLYEPTFVASSSAGDSREGSDASSEPSFVLGKGVVYCKAIRRYARDVEMDLLAARTGASLLSERVRWASVA